MTSRYSNITAATRRSELPRPSGERVGVRGLGLRGNNRAPVIPPPSLPDLIRQSMRRLRMDHRVKPGSDEDAERASAHPLVAAKAGTQTGG
jgi:hypothetical protein